MLSTLPRWVSSLLRNFTIICAIGLLSQTIAHAQLSINFTANNPTCFNLPNGSIIAAASGGTFPYSYVWNTGQIGPSLVGVVAGSYSVTVTDSDGLSLSASITLDQPTLITLDLQADEPCAAPFDILSNADGGIPPYTYNWNTGANTADLIDVPAGTYCVTVVDANNCGATDCITVDAIPPTVSLAKVNVSCPGGNDGSVTATATGGTAPFSYLWNTGDTGPSLGNISAGIYSVTVTDANGCTATASTTVSSPPNIILTVVTSDPACVGDTNGSITTTTTGGTPPYTYLWSNGATEPNLFNLPPGDYEVTVTDANNCTVVVAAGLVTLSNLIVGALGTPETCPDANDGFLTASSTGGVLPLTYQWSNGATTQVVTNVEAGSYTVTITDAVGCSGTAPATVTEPPVINLSIDADNVCIGESTGKLTVNANGGTPPYSYLWNTGATTPTIEDLPVGSYSVTVTDSNNCPATISADIGNFPNPVCVVTIVQESTMGNNGILEVIANAGQTPYTYLWSNGATTANISGLAPGDYSVTVTDANGCETSCMASLAALAGIGDYVWEDLDLDGQQDDGEPAVPGITVNLKNAMGDVIASTVTDDDGLYLFLGLDAGTYSVQFEIPDGFSYTLSNQGDDALDNDIIPAMNGMTGQYTLMPGEINLTVDAGIYQTPVPVVGDPCNCLNNATNEFNGQFMELVTITSYPGQTWTITDQMNLFSVASPPPPAPPIPTAIGTVIPEVSPGNYELEFRLVDELTYFIEFTNGLDTFSFTNTCTYPTIMIDELPPDSICVFDETYPLSGTASVPGTITFMLNGEEVTEIDPSILLPGNNELIASLVPIDPDECIGVLTYQFITVEECDAKIGDFVWLDDNQDGIQDPDESGIPGVTVIVNSTDPMTPYADTTQTNDLGIYCFNVPPGSYKVTFENPTGLFPTLPDQGTNDSLDSDMDTIMLMTIPVTVGPNEEDLTLDGGFYNKCNNVDDPGTIGFDQMVCGPGADPDPFVNLGDPSGGSGDLEYLWMMTTGDPSQDIQFWTPIPNSDSPVYDPGPVFETTYFTRCVRRECCIAYLESNILTITVGDDAVAIIDGPNLVCEGESVDFEAIGTGAGATIDWTFSGSATPAMASGASVNTTWSSFGVFSVELYVTENGCTSYATQQVTVSNSPGACGNGFVLSAEVNNLEEGFISLKWEMEDLFPDFLYQIEHSKDGINFESIGQVSSHTWILGSMLQYEFEAQVPTRGRNYFRVLFHTDQNLAVYSNMEEIILQNDSEIALLYPNPVKDLLVLELLDIQGEEVIDLEIYSATGGLMSRQKVALEQERLELDTSNYPTGAYFIRLKLGGEEVKTLKVLKQ